MNRESAQIARMPLGPKKIASPKSKGPAFQPTATYRALVERLVALRKQKDLTQEALAKKIGVATISVWRYENLHREIGTEDLHKIEDVLGGPGTPVLVARDSANSAAYGTVSHPAGKVASIKSRLEVALDQRSDQFEKQHLLFIQREIELLAPRLADSTLTDEAIAAYIDGLANAARRFGGGHRS